MRFERAFIPVGGVWSSPFARWQGPLAEMSSLDLAVAVTKGALEDRAIPAQTYSQLVLGWTIPQPGVFYGASTVASRIGAPELTGPMVAQPCATSAAALTFAANHVESSGDAAVLAVLTDRTRNGLLLVYPSGSSPGGSPPHRELGARQLRGRSPSPASQWSRPQRTWRPRPGSIDTSSTRSPSSGTTSTRPRSRTIRRSSGFTWSQYTFRPGSRIRSWWTPMSECKRRRPSGSPSSNRSSRTGSLPTAPTAARSIRPTAPPARSSPRETGQPRSVAMARSCGCSPPASPASAPAQMPKAPVPAARTALRDAGLDIDGMHSVVTHDPFTVNDIWFSRQTGVRIDKMNIHGSSLVYGHPQAPTGARLVAELIETLVLRGGEYGLFTGCAAGDSAGALVIEVGS